MAVFTRTAPCLTLVGVESAKALPLSPSATLPYPSCQVHKPTEMVLTPRSFLLSPLPGVPDVGMADALAMAKATDMWSLRYLKVG